MSPAAPDAAAAALQLPFIALCIGGVVTCAVGFFTWRSILHVRSALEIMRYRQKLLRWALLEISRQRDCSCSPPCGGACQRQEVAAVENEMRIGIARAALKADEAFNPPQIPPLPKCERPVSHAGVNAEHRSFMDRLTCPCSGCVKWRDLTK